MAPLLATLRRRFGRQDSGGGHTSGNPVELDRYPGVEDLYLTGDFDAATALIRQTDPQLSPADVARIDLQLRHQAYLTLQDGAAPEAPWPPAVTQMDSPLDVPADELNAEVLIDGVRGHGYVIVRGLFDEQTCDGLRSMVDQTFEAKADPATADRAWFTPLCDVNGELLDPRWRGITDWADSALPVPDSPLTAKAVIEAFGAAGVPELVRTYLGVQPMLTLEKWNLRRVPATTGTSWHQDGAFMGTDLHTINLWVTLSDCGEQAPGLDMVGKRFDHIVATGTTGAHFDWDVSPTVVDEERGEALIVSPTLKAGDAVFFDHYLLHRTGVRPGMTETRYALESWFFTPWSKPDGYEGILI